MVATTVLLPVINVYEYIENPQSEQAKEECVKLAEAVKTYGAFAIRDKRVTEQENNDFLDLIEDYFDQPTEEKLKDTRPDLHFQVGATPDNTELPRCGRDDDCIEMVAKVRKAYVDGTRE
jgi:isopenicillin N synthase-like dioxygenase